MTGTLSETPFVVVERRHGFPDATVLLKTHDWVEAEALALTPWPCDVEYRAIQGTHSTHDWDDQNPRRCRNCDGWDNGSYGSHAPCGYDWSQVSLRAALIRARAT
jgi:hypothetical protein